MQNHDLPGQAANKSSEVFGRLLRFWREGFRMTQEHLAELVDISPRHNSRLENGLVRPSDEMVLRICHALELRGRDRDWMIYAASLTGDKQPVATRQEPAPWVSELFTRLLESLEPSPAAVVTASARLVIANNSWWTLFNSARAGSDQDNFMGEFWRTLFASSERHQPPRWAQSRIALLLSMKLIAILRGDPGMESLCRDLTENYDFPTDWPRQASRLEARANFPVVLESAEGL